MANNVLPTTTRGMNYTDHDANLQAQMRRIMPDTYKRRWQELRDFGAWVGGALDEQATYSDRFAPPQVVADLSVAGKPGERRNRVLFNAQYEESQREVYKYGVIGHAFEGDTPEPHTLSFAMGYLLSHSDISTHCPVTMTGAVAYVVSKYASDEIKRHFLHESTRMDGEAKTGGTWATEKHSGSDVGQTASSASYVSNGSFASDSLFDLLKQARIVTLQGQKWFASNASSGLVVATARPDGAPEGGKGLGLYLVPSHIDRNWSVRNNYDITALKDKLGTRGLATAEIDLNGTYAIELVPPPHGLRVMMEALTYSRVHNAMSAAGVAHRALLEAQSWMENRVTFGKKLIDRPMNQKKLIGMAVDWLSASALSFEAASSFDAAQNGDAEATTWMRLVTAIAKFKTAESAVRSATLATQMVGGNGITTDWATERQVRDTLILPVWEGPEQIQALELMRVILGAEKGGDVLLKRLGDMARGLPEEMKHERLSLTYKISTLKAMIDDLTANPASAEFVADDILHDAGDVLTYALLCHEAQWELANDQNPIKQMAAEKFADLTFGQRHNRHTDPVKLTESFNALVRGIIPPTWKPASQQGTLPGSLGTAPSP